MSTMPMRLAVLPLAILLAAAGVPDTVHAQGPSLVPVTIMANVGGKPLTMRADGECKHAPIAAAYGVRSAMWKVWYSGHPDAEIHNLHLTMWRPFAGGSPEQFSLAMRTGGVDYLIDTVKGGPIRGSGTITYKPNNAGGGGQFELHGRTADNTEIRVRLVCPKFATLNRVGG
jgi:hypothetical protein